MVSPIHKFLFSPPPSPPGETDTGAPYSFQSLVSNVAPRSGSKSPRPADTDMFPLSVPTPPMRSSSPLRHSRSHDAESGGSVSKSFAQRTPILGAIRIRLQAITPNIPRPILRLFAFVAFLFVFLSFVSNVVLPALSPLPQAPPVAKKPQWVPPKQYVPPQVNAHPLVAPNPRAFRPEPHAIPQTHELLALQSFVLESSSNELGDVDPSKPLDAADLLGTHAARRLGGSGSKRELKWLQELEEEHAKDVVLWYNSIAPPHYALDGISSRHGEGRRATLISTVSRPDGEIIEGVLKRLGHDLTEAPVLVIGGEVFDATTARMEELRSSGALAERLGQIGWNQ